MCLETERLAAFDLDGTLLNKNSSFAFCNFLYQQGFFSLQDLLFCASTYFRYHFLNLSLLTLHTQVFKQLFKGKNISQLQPYLIAFLNEKLDSLWYQPALNRLYQHQKEGARCLILSSSPYFLVAPLAGRLGVKEVFATHYSSDIKGNLTELTLLMDGAEKASVLASCAGEIKIAYSDSPDDLPFLERADRAVAVNPKRRLKKIARLRKWEIL